MATNEYGEYDRGALALYGFDMLVEPYKETTISVAGLASSSGSTSFTWLLSREDDDETEVIDLKVVEQDDAPSGSSVKVTLTEAGTTYALRVQQREFAPEGGGDASIADTVVVSEKTIQVTCKYVRRELRDLTSADRTAFFSAMQEFYTVDLEAGKDKYGKTFANSRLMSGYHNSGVSAGGRNTIRSAQRVLVHDSRSGVQTPLSFDPPRLKVGTSFFRADTVSAGIPRSRKNKPRIWCSWTVLALPCPPPNTRNFCALMMY